MSTKKSTALATKKASTISKKGVEAAKYRQQILAMERQGKLAAWNDYIGFGVSKFLGLGGLIVGGLEYLDPNILPIVLHNPETVAGVGLALLTGKSLVTFIAKIEKSLGGKQ